MVDKFFTTLQERIALLRRKGMTVDTDNPAHMQVLQEYNYYNVFSGYRAPFLDPAYPAEKRFVSGVTPVAIKAFYDADKELRIVFLKYLLDIEERFKHQLTQAFYGYHMQHNQQLSAAEKAQLNRERGYLHYALYDTTNESKTHAVAKAIGGIEAAIDKQYQREHALIRHYRDDYGYVLLWIAMNVLTFGNAGRYFQVQLPAIKKDTLDALGFPKWRDLEARCAEFMRCLEVLTDTRNVCAHGERLFPVRHEEPLTRQFYRLSKEGAALFERRQGGLFQAIFATYVLLPNDERQAFVAALQAIDAQLRQQLAEPVRTAVRRCLDFDCDWQQALPQGGSL